MASEQTKDKSKKPATEIATKAKRKPRYYESSESESGSDDEMIPVRNMSNRVTKTAGDMGNSTTTTMGNVAGTAIQSTQQGGNKNDTLRLRLDLNLEVEITLKARIHGDLELALL